MSPPDRGASEEAHALLGACVSRAQRARVSVRAGARQAVTTALLSAACAEPL